MSAARDAADEYERRQAKVVAVNPGSLSSHKKWAEQLEIPFPICVDAEREVAAAYGALKPEGGIKRSVIVINKSGAVTWVQEGAPSTEEIMGALDALAHDDPDSTRLSSS